MKVRSLLAAGCGLLALASAAHAETTRTTVAPGNWSDPAIWGGTVPEAGDHVIANHTVTQNVASAALGSFSNKVGTTLMFVGWDTALTATEVTIAGTVTHPAQSATQTNAAGLWVPDNRVWIVCTNLTLAAGAQINVSEKGYLGGQPGAGTNNPPGRGPGASKGGTYNSGGAGYGGTGGTGTDNIADQIGVSGGGAYGDYTAPTDPGSGAGGCQSGVTLFGGAGGGAVRIEATGSVLVDGSILANGQSRGSYPGSGSGGGVFITCQTFAGTGSVSVVGGNDIRASHTRAGGAGGGGRIAVVYDTAAQAGVSPQPTVIFNAGGGFSTWASVTVTRCRRNRGDPGTLYLSDAQFLDWSRVRGGTIKVPGVTALTTNAMTLAHNVIRLDPGFTLTVTGDLTLTGTGGLDMTNGTLTVGGNLIVSSDRRAGVRLMGGPSQVIDLGGNLSLTKGWFDIDTQGMPVPGMAVLGDVVLDEGFLYVFARPDQTTTLSVAGGASATNASQVYLHANLMPDPVSTPGILVDVAGAMSLATNCWVLPHSHPTNGGSVFVRVGQLAVLPGGGINASEKGFWGGQRFTVNNPPGYGPGRGLGAGTGSSGGGYGGRGGHTVASLGGKTNAVGGPVYGAILAPDQPGSGAGGTYTSGTGGTGGGLIHVQASGTVLLDGSLLADGGIGNNSAYPGSGSGGGIYVACKRFEGKGLLRANGASRSAGQGTAGSGGGGGGRIAVRTGVPYNAPMRVRLVEADAPATFTGSAQALGGTGRYTPDNTADNGTVRFVQALPPGGTLLLIK